MDLNLDFGLPICPPPLSVDLGYDLALNALPLSFSSSHINDIIIRIPSIDAVNPFDEILESDNIFEPFDLPPYNDTPPIPHSESLTIDNEPLARTGGPSLRREHVEYPEFGPQRVFGSRHWSEMPMTRLNQAESDVSADSTTDPERLMCEIRRSARSVGSVGQNKANEKGPQVEGSEDEKKEKTSSASDFDCNICFEVAKEPVVTCCGHLFCWPCLYQWLRVHCDYKECPVCKGKVNVSSIVPIYGRGSSESGKEKKNKESSNEHDGLKIPPRPRGNRVESLRQHLHRPLFRRSEAWIQEVQELFSELPERFRFFQREERRIHAQPPARDNPVVPQGLTWTRVNEVSHDPNQSPSQVSTSSTMAVIQEDILTGSDVFLGANNGGSSMVLRSRARGRSSNSLDTSGHAAPHLRQNQRRRIN